jgi:hypothetical protein
MRVKLILPALAEAESLFFRPIEYSLLPPLGLATLAGFGTAEKSRRQGHTATVADERPEYGTRA